MDISAKLFTDGSEDVQAFNNLFLLFEKVWKGAWGELGVDGQSMYDDFFRFDYKVGFFRGDVPIAFHGYQFFDLKRLADQNHTYFKRLPQSILDGLDDLDVSSVVTMEYLAVDPAFRKTAGFSVAEVFVGFSTQFLSRWPIHGIIGVTRNDRHVDALCRKYGSMPLLTNFGLHNVKADFVIFLPQKLTKNSDPVIQATIDQLLNNVGFSLHSRKAS